MKFFKKIIFQVISNFCLLNSFGCSWFTCEVFKQKYMALKLAFKNDTQLLTYSCLLDLSFNSKTKHSWYIYTC